ncbi:hypothetical protein [Neisseria bacilliformis]|uniref:hypothetical protein n=1 Tax=Neisseria bacilliformis TaxID=267212 RepID=UPI000668A177|nr:hypothetical protein [Neisseria bacilliformis]
MNPISRRRFLHGLAACGLLLSGCGRQPENENPAASETASAASEAAAKPQLLYRFGLPADPPTFRRIYAAGPPAEVLLHALAPERMAGWTTQKSPQALALFDEPSRRLPVLGGINGRGRPVSAEQLLQRKVDLIVDAGRVNAKLLSTAEETAKRLGIPYLLLDGRLAQAPAQIRLLGGILASPHTERLAALAQTALDFAAERAKSRRAAPRRAARRLSGTRRRRAGNRPQPLHPHRNHRHARRTQRRRLARRQRRPGQSAVRADSAMAA